MRVVALLAVATGFLHLADARTATREYATKMRPDLGAVTATIGPCRRYSRTYIRCWAHYTGVEWLDSRGDLDESVRVFLRRGKIRIVSDLFDQ